MEGANTKVKLVKRPMYGRAGFPLLRRRILLTWITATTGFVPEPFTGQTLTRSLHTATAPAGTN
jgi:hypothetical protein